MTNALTIPQEQLHAIADNCVRSGLFGIKTEAQAMALMALCQAEGLHPAKAIQDYHIIQGRPALKSDAMLARFQQAGGVVEWVEYSDVKVSGRFSHPQSSPTPVLIEWTIEQAKRIGLAGKDNWKNYPRAMLRARVVSEGVRTVYPGIASGIDTVEEVQDMPPQGIRDMGAGEVVSDVDSAAAVTAIHAAETRADLQALWRGFSANCAKANDTQAYATIKAAVA